MEPTASAAEARTLIGKKRIPKACNSCRHSKLRCDEQKPICGRCQSLRKSCVYVQKPKSQEALRIEELEQEVASLQRQVNQQLLRSHSIEQMSSSKRSHQSTDATSPHSVTSVTYSSPSNTTDRPLKRKRSQFQMQKEVSVPDYINEGVLSEHQALHFFTCFFRGCDRYVPIFDQSDTFNSIRARSGLLLNAICAVGCSVCDDTTVDSRFLRVRLNRWLTTVVLNSFNHSLETVQALLIMACWWPERSLLLAVATRMAVELHLDDAFEQLINLALNDSDANECKTLMRSARTWALVWNLEQILQIDAGNLLSFKVKGVRRCRALLNKAFSAKLDARLFSQVELNSVRIKVTKNLTIENDDLLQAVHDARIDIAIWYDDWKRIIETSPLSGSELPSLMINLTVQRHWADAMAVCRAIHATGVTNYDLMSANQKQMLELAREALQHHLHAILVQPTYLANFRFAIDFVWAKCTFSFLLLLKLTILISHDSAEYLLGQGQALHEALSKSCAFGSGKVYLRLLQLTLDKFACRGGAQSTGLDAFVPEEFVFEWDFPGLNLFSSPTGWELLFDQYSLGEDLFVGMYD